MAGLTRCICGHDADDHNGPIGDCQARCLCETCPDDTRNDCWCAGFKDGCTTFDHASWHIDGGPCAYVTTVLDDNGKWQVDSKDCTCGHLELQHVEIF